MAGRSRVVQQFERQTAENGGSSSAVIEAEVMRRVAEAARAEADAAAEKVKVGFFQRNKQGVTHALWSFVMLGLGAQVVSMTYRKNDAEKAMGEMRDELSTLKDLINPYGVWFREVCDRAQLSANQRASLTASFNTLDVAAVSEEQVAMVLKSAGIDPSNHSDNDTGAGATAAGSTSSVSGVAAIADQNTKIKRMF